jgi:hypothetical protein
VVPSRERLSFKLFHLVEGEAEGPFAIAALVFVAVLALISGIAIRLH